MNCSPVPSGAVVSATFSASLKRQGPNVTQVPPNLDDMSQKDLIALVRSLATERDELRNQVGPTKKKTKVSTTASLAAVAAAPVTSISPVATASVTALTLSEVTAVKKRLGKAAVKAVKKATHGGTKKPTSEVSEGNMSQAMASALMSGYEPKSDTKRMTKWNLYSGEKIAELLICDRLVHPVKHDGKGFIFLGGGSPKIYAWAGFENMEIKYVKRERMLSLKIRSFVAGTGRAEVAQGLLAYAKGQALSIVEEIW